MSLLSYWYQWSSWWCSSGHTFFTTCTVRKASATAGIRSLNIFLNTAFLKGVKTMWQFSGINFQASFLKYKSSKHFIFCLYLITIFNCHIIKNNLCIYPINTHISHFKFKYRFGGVMISVLASGMVDRGFSQTMKLVFVASLLSTHF